VPLAGPDPNRHSQSELRPATVGRRRGTQMGSDEAAAGAGMDRRHFFRNAAAGAALVGSFKTASAQQREADSPGAAPSDGAATRGSATSALYGQDPNTADVIVDTLIVFGATHAFGVVGDGINSFIEALRKREDRIRYVGVRHEEAAAFMASGHAKHTGRSASAWAPPAQVPFTC
jgi:pyruvate dehydrogenase (quinone)